jgi:uncharacterized protein (TIGR02145 family)
MKKAFLLFAMACFVYAGVLAQNGEIANLQVAQRTDGSGLVDIHFDLNGTGASYNLQFEASFDDGVNYEPLSETFLTGELTDVLPGTGKHIIWAGKDSHPETFSTQTRARVIAIEYIPPTVPTVITAEITGITSTSAISGGNVTNDGGAPVTARGVVWSTTTNPTLEENDGFTEDGDGLGEFVSEITGLQPGVEYFVRGYAINDTGLGYGDVIEFSTNLDGMLCPGTPTITDIDGNVYNTVLIGDQCWMRENLNVGNMISGSNSQTNNGTIEKYCYANNPDNCNIYGGLYQWNEMMQYTTSPGTQGICPSGWKVPSDEDWNELTTYVSSQSHYLCNNEHEYISKALAAKENWNSSSNLCEVGYHLPSNNMTGFSGIPGGIRKTDGTFEHYGSYSDWWTSTQSGSNSAWDRFLSFESPVVSRSNNGKENGFSVRCLKNQTINSIVPSAVTLPINNITSTSAISGGNVTDDGGAEVTQRGVVWSTTPNPTLEVNDGFTEDGEGLGEFVSEISGLQPETTYHVRAYAENSEGVGYGEELSFSTTEWQCGDLIFDIDGNSYNTVLIGDQCWMAENLKTTKYRDETPLDYPGDDNQAWQNNLTGVYSWYENDINNKPRYGALYSFNAVKNPKGLCPEGWLLPIWSANNFTGIGEYNILNDFLGGNEISGGKLKSERTDPLPHPRWNLPNFGATNESAFSGLPGGIRYADGMFDQLGEKAHFWQVIYLFGEIQTSAAIQQLSYDNEGVFSGPIQVPHQTAISIRCIKATTSLYNRPPFKAINPSPTDLSGDNLLSVMLTWESYDPEGDTLTFDVCFGVDENPPIAVTGISEQSYTTDTLEYSTTYYWKIVAHDNQGNSTEGEVWSFITMTNPEWQCGDVLFDSRDGQEYTTVQIGEQCWMAENINIGIRIDANINQTNNGVIEKYCYNNLESNCDVYGGLYRWDEMMGDSTTPGIQGICPDGWYLPTDEEWTALTTYVSSKPEYLCNSDTNYITKALAATTNWNTHSGTCAVGNNLSANNATGFTALPGGYCGPHGSFNQLSNFGWWWSSSEDLASSAWLRYIYYNGAEVYRGSYAESYSLSVRCLKD